MYAIAYVSWDIYRFPVFRWSNENLIHHFNSSRSLWPEFSVIVPPV